MSEDQIYTIVFLVILMIIFFLKMTFNFVSSKSVRCSKIKLLNSRQHFRELERKRKVSFECNDKRQYDHFDINQYILSGIAESIQDVETLVSSININKEMYKHYSKEYSAIMISKTDYTELAKGSLLSPNVFKSIEKFVCEVDKLSPVMDYNLTVIVSYTSPQGRNSYEKSYNVSFGVIEKLYNEFLNRAMYRQSAQYERSKMTDRLRYKILKRDNFRCTICGASQADGVKLHVDHIIPVSKGGKTVESNLRTLCERCNLGKGDMYDEDGIN